MEAVSLAASILAVVDLWRVLKQSITKFYPKSADLKSISYRTNRSILLVQLWLSEAGLDERIKGQTWDEYRLFIHDEIQELHRFLESSKLKMPIRLMSAGLPPERIMIQLAERIEKLAYFSRDVAQILASKGIQQHLDTILEMLGKSTRESAETWETAQSIKKHTEAGASFDNEFAAALTKMEEEHPEWSSNERQRKIDEVRAIIRLNMRNHDQFDRDRMTFPFCIVVQNSDPLETRVKLDTGSRPNWISAQLLSRAAISFQPEDDLGQFIGAGKDALPFEPLGVTSVTWFSENQARTRTTEFLVHNGELPVNVLLGSEWVIEDIAQERFPEPVLPVVRHILNSDELNKLETDAREDGASNDLLIRLQNQQKKAKREENRLLKAASRAMTPRSAVSLFGSVTPTRATRRGSLASVAPPFVISPQTLTLTPETTVSTGVGYPEVGESSTAASSQTSGLELREEVDVEAKFT